MVQAFRVLTEFRFETGAAIASVGPLKSAVDGLSQSADDALFSFQKLGLGIVAQFVGGPGGGILGVLGTAVKNAEMFKQSQIGLANVLGASAGSFADRMNFARTEMEKISKLAVATGISGKDLIQFTKVITPAVRPKLGAVGGVRQSAELGRVFLKSAPSLGIDQEYGVGQLRRLVLGLDAAGNQLFDVLTADTEAMRQFAGQGKKFQALPIAEKMKKLTAAFAEFAQGDPVKAFENSISGQFNILKELMIGAGSVLRPLGESFSTLIVDALKILNKFIAEILGPTIKNIAFGLEPWLKSSESLLVTLMGLSKLTADFAMASGLLMKATALLGVHWVMTALGLQIPIVTMALNAFAASVAFLEKDLLAAAIAGKGGIAGRLAALSGASGGIFGFFNQLTILISRFLGPLALLVFVFQLLSRAAAIFKVNQAKALAGFMERLSEVGALFMRLGAIFNEGFNNLAAMIAQSPVFDALLWVVDRFIDVIEVFGKGIMLAVAGFQGLSFALFEFFNQMKSMVLFKGFDGAAIGKAFDAGMEDIFEKTLGAIERGDAIQNNVINQDIKMNNSFKESLEPDRIAFTIRDQLFKAALNPKEALGGAGIQGSFRSTQ